MEQYYTHGRHSLYRLDTIHLVPGFLKEQKECIAVKREIGGENVVLRSFRIVMLKDQHRVVEGGAWNVVEDNIPQGRFFHRS